MNYANQPLSELVIAIPMATELFRKNRLDFCCGGQQTLKDACEKRELDVNEMVYKLQELAKKEQQASTERPLHEMTAYIIERYHNDLRRRLPELLALSMKVEQVHGDHPNCPHGLYQLLKNFHEEMLMHMMKEENVLFPLIDSGRGSLALMPVKVMSAEHDAHGKQLDEIHVLTNDFNPPEGACSTWKALYNNLEKLEEELMDHIHLENNILFPSALAQKGA